MHSILPANALLGLLAAASWGGGDFAGSMAVQRGGSSLRAALRVVAIGHPLSLIVLLAVALSTGTVPTHGVPILWGVMGGLVSGISVAAFYMALSSGHMGSAAAVSGLLCAGLPAIVSALVEGRPGALRLAGFALAASAIWLIAAGDSLASADRRAMMLSVASGLGFGVYFVCLKFAGAGGVLWGTVAARVGSAGVCAILLLFVREPTANTTAMPLNRATWLWLLGGAALDTVGNVAYTAATRFGRMDVAAVLAALYPAGTILLAAAILHERTTVRQKLGMALALPAAVLITL